MKCIETAMNETEFKPRKKWWGFTDSGKRYLCRYNHVMAIFSESEVLFAGWETKTDRAGVENAIEIFNKRKKKFSS